jgi:acyl carrier protein
MTMSSIEELRELIQEKYGIEPAALDPHASMRAAGIDSLALVEFLFEVENRMGITLPDAYPDIDTLAALAATVDELRAAATTG